MGKHIMGLKLQKGPRSIGLDKTGLHRRWRLQASHAGSWSDDKLFQTIKLYYTTVSFMLA